MYELINRAASVQELFYETQNFRLSQRSMGRRLTLDGFALARGCRGFSRPAAVVCPLWLLRGLRGRLFRASPLGSFFAHLVEIGLVDIEVPGLLLGPFSAAVQELHDSAEVGDVVEVSELFVELIQLVWGTVVTDQA